MELKGIGGMGKIFTILRIVVIFEKKMKRKRKEK